MDEKLIRRLYLDEHLGLRKIAETTGIPPATVRRRLISMGVYEGVAHGVACEEEESGEESKPAIEVVCPALDLEQWTCRGVSTKRDGEGWLINLGSGVDSELTSPCLPREWLGKGIEFSAGLRLIAPAFGSLVMGIRDEGFPHGDESNCLISADVIPSKWCTRHICQSAPMVFFKPNSYQRIAAHISNLMVKEIPLTGLKIISIPAAEEKLKPGDRINLRWQADGGCRFKLIPSFDRPNVLEVDFLAFSSLYSDLTHIRGKRVQLTVEMMGAGDIEIDIGDNTGSEKRRASLKREPSAWRLEKTIGQGGHVRLSNRGYENFKVYLGNAFVEIIN